MPKTFVSPVILKIFSIRSCVQNQVQRAVVRPHPLQAADQHPQAGGVEEPGLLQVDDELVVVLAGQIDEQLAQPRRGVDIDLALDVDDLDAVFAVVTQLQIHKSSSRHARRHLNVHPRRMGRRSHSRGVIPRRIQPRSVIISIRNHAFGSAVGILQVHHEIPGGLCRPGRRRVDGGAQDPDSPAGVLDHREHVQPRPGQGDRLEEVTGQQGLSLGAQEIGPGGETALGRRVDPGLVQDLPDDGSGDLHPEYQQLAMHPAIPHPGFSRTRRSTRTRIERTVRGRPGCRGRDRWARRRATASRCQRSTVSGRTTRCSRLSTCLGSRCSSAASNARSPVVNRTLSGPSCRCRSESWWRSARISASVPVAHRQQPQQREHVRHTKVGQSQQHGPSPCHSVPPSHERPADRYRVQRRAHLYNCSNQHG